MCGKLYCEIHHVVLVMVPTRLVIAKKGGNKCSLANAGNFFVFFSQLIKKNRMVDREDFPYMRIGHFFKHSAKD